MDTPLDAAKLRAKHIAIGMRFRGSYLVQQAGYTLGLAALEGTALAGKLPPNFLERTQALRGEVEQAMGDKTVRTAEARQATNLQHQCHSEAKSWVRGIGKRCQSAVHLGAPLAPELEKVSSPASVAGMLEQVGKTLSLLTKHAADMDKVGLPVQSHIEEGHKLYLALQEADSVQERARAAELPAAVADFCAKKGELYGNLRVINNAGHELHSSDLGESAKFNMSILNRRAPQAAAPTPPPAVPTPSAG
jgi:hypothetical protein